jgi:alpha-1,3-glucosyltransferase
MLHQIALSSYQKKGSTSSAITRGLLLCMACSSMSFFMFSFQVHEKSILLPLLPITALAALDPLLALYSPLVACLSMWPLLHRDGVIACYIAIPLIYLVMSLSSAHSLFLDRFIGRAKSSGRSIHMTVGSLVIASCLLLHLIRALIPPPENLPWLHDRAFITFGFGFFGASVLYLNWRQWERVTDKQS